LGGRPLLPEVGLTAALFGGRPRFLGLQSVELADFGGRPRLRVGKDGVWGGRTLVFFPGELVGVLTSDFVAILLCRDCEDRFELATLESLLASIALLGVFCVPAVEDDPLRVDIFEAADFSHEGQNHFCDEGTDFKPKQKV
jgi:hypothetical protein